GRTATQDLSITVDPPTLTVTTATLPNATVGVAYSQTLAASGGSGGNAWTISAGSLPAGLNLSAAGAITGTPTATGASNFTVRVADNGGRSATKALSIVVDPPALTITTTALPPGVVGAAYSFAFSATGGTGGYAWSITAGQPPAGLALNASGTLAGRPTTPGTSNFTVQVKDSAGTGATKALSLTVTPSTLSITTQSLPPATQGTAYSQALTASGGTGGYRWSIDAGDLPTGLALDPAGRIAGTPTGGSATFTLGVSDSSGVSVNRNLTISVTPPLSLPTSTTLPSGVTGTTYSGTVGASGGQTPYTFTVASGQLPPGLSLDSRTGAITGRPTQVGNFTFAIQVRDAGNSQAQSSFTIAIANTLTVITQPVLPGGTVGVSYQTTLTAAGGTSPYSWSVTAGSLPPGLSFRPDGGIQGTPSGAGNFTFTATVTDAVGARATKDFTLTIAATLNITTVPQLPQGVPGSPYNATLAASGGTPPYQWSLVSGALADGLRLDAATGAITGIPSAPVTANFSAAVSDSRNVTAQKAFTMTVAPGVTFTSAATLPGAVAGEQYSFTFTATGGRAPYSWRIADGELPDGLALNAVSGTISGTPSASGTFNFTVEVADAAGLKTNRVHTVVVDLPTVATLRVNGVPATLGPMQQPQVDLVLVNPYPVAITGRLNLSFVPASGMPDDPSVQFSSGGRSASFTIAANDTRAAFSVPRLLIQSGSVAGTIQFTVESLRAGSSTLPAPSSPIGTAQIPASAAVVRTMEVRRSSGGFDLVVSGASTTRELARAIVRFRPPAGATLQTTELTIELADAARGWFQSSGSTQYGGQFTLTIPFTFVGGPSAIESVAVVLANNAGSSQEVAGPY
ncbi:MAG TPA: putative Ig domain-containing protein, partial [Gemmataceae bacterium]|nr:putative Ig domain-containing protein [Gemmataceae bacterium]